MPCISSAIKNPPLWPHFSQGYHCLIKFNLHKLVCFHTSLIFICWMLFQKILKDISPYLTMHMTSPIPPLGLWYELESTHLLEDASTHKFGFFGHLVFEKKIIVILYIFFIYNYVKIHFPIVVPPNPQGPWFEQSWFYTTWGCLLTSSRFSGFWEDCSRFSVYMYILIMSRGDNEDELYVMMIIILHGNYFNATVKRFGGDNF